MNVANHKTVDILLVEDNPADAHLIELAIESYKEPLQILWIENGEDALNYFRAEDRYTDPDHRPKPRLIILDLKLPRFTGNEILQTKREWKGLSDVPVVMHSSSRLHQDIHSCLENGANDFFVKSIDLSDFFSDCHRIFDTWLKPKP